MGKQSTAALPIDPETLSAGTAVSTFASLGESSFLAADIVSPWQSFVFESPATVVMADTDLNYVFASGHHSPWEVRVAGQWHGELAARLNNPRADAQDWLSIGTFLDADAFAVRRPEPARPSDSAFLRKRIDELMRSLDGFPTCYNQSLLMGSLAYSGRALRRNDRERVESIEAIRRYVDYVEPLISPFRTEVPSGWAKLDLGLCSDRFENLQDSLSALGIVPRLADMTIEEMLEG